MTDIHGEVAPGFEPVRDAFARNFAEHGEVGAACCVYLGGEPVVDIWGGLADREESRPWRDDAAIFFWPPKGSQFYDNEIASSRLKRESQ